MWLQERHHGNHNYLYHRCALNKELRVVSAVHYLASPCRHFKPRAHYGSCAGFPRIGEKREQKKALETCAQSVVMQKLAAACFCASCCVCEPPSKDCGACSQLLEGRELAG